MKKNTGILTLLVTLAVTVVLIYGAAVGFGETRTGAAKNIKLGLDLAGGVSITYQTVLDKPTQEQMDDTIYKLQKRVEGYSTEAVVYQEGDNRINIEIPGVSDANAILEELGRPGSLEFLDLSGTVLIEGTDIKGAEAKGYTDNLGKNSYGWVIIDEEDNITGVSVKRPISSAPMEDYAIVASFWFRKGRIFVEAAEKMIAEDDRVNGEFYVDQAVNHVLALGYRAKVYEIQRYIGWGTPKDYESFQKTFEYWDGFCRRERLGRYLI